MALLAKIALALLISSITTAQSFTVDLIHRDSPKSPSYISSDTSFDRLHHALRRSFNRTKRIGLARAKVMNSPQSNADGSPQNSHIVTRGGEYLLNISIGTPPVNIIAIADTGSDLTWTQCEPCTQCFNQTAPLFDPQKSSTYRHVRCNSSACQSTMSTLCEEQRGGRSSACQYMMQYGDGSHTTGALSVDKITLGTAASRPSIFGCGLNNNGTFISSGASGVIGLGGGNSSILHQMSREIGGIFSYCLRPLSDESGVSKMSFGRNAVVAGPGTVLTPIVSKGSRLFYHLTLKSFSVGPKTVPFDGADHDSGVAAGNIIIDSGTTLTVLPQEVYSGLEAAVSEQIGAEKVKDPRNLLASCYRDPQGDFDSPVITAHFDGGDLRLMPQNTFVRIAKDVVCFAFVPDDSIAIWGNMAQMNFLVGYDLNRGTVSFRPQDCSK